MLWEDIKGVVFFRGSGGEVTEDEQGRRREKKRKEDGDEEGSKYCIPLCSEIANLLLVNVL